MKMIKYILKVLIVLVFLQLSALADGFYTNSGEIIYAAQCPEGYQEIAEKLSLGVGEMRVIASEAKYFASDDMDILTIDEFGVMHALAPGKTTVSVYLEENNRKDFTVEVSKAPSSLKLSKSKGTLEIGETYQLKATLTKSTVATITWYSSSPGIVDVDDTGRLTALGEGTCTITARTHNGLTAECTVKVTLPPPALIELFTDTYQLAVGESASVLYTLKGGYNETVEWTTLNDAVAVVDQNGVITAVAPGKTVICMEASGGDILFVDVLVDEGSTKVEFLSSEMTMYTGGRLIIEPVVEGGSGKYEYVSMDESIASIDPETGEICAKRAGSVYILALTPNYAFDEFLLNIVNGPDELILTPERYEIAIGDSIYTSNNLSGFESQYLWYESSNPEIAGVNEYGMITGVKKGTAVISIHSGGLVGTAEISVLPVAEKITAQPEANVLGVGDSCKVSYTLSKGTGTVRYSSSDPAIARVNEETGTIYALSEGTCKITLTLQNDVSDTFTLEVRPAPESVYIEKSAYTLAASNSHIIRFGVNEGAATQFAVSSSDPEIVRYEGGMLICPGKTGNAVITVLTHNDLSAKADINVIPAPGEIGVHAEKLTLNPDFDYYVILREGKTHALDAYIENVPDIVILYSASHPKTASVDESGVVTAHKEGTSLITVSLFSGTEARVLISVE